MIMENEYLTARERAELPALVGRVMRAYDSVLEPADASRLRRTLRAAIESGHYGRNHFGFNGL